MFNFKGSYKWYWKNRFAVIKNIRPDFGRQIKKTLYDEYEEEKIWSTYYDVDKSFRPYQDIEDLLMILCWRVLKWVLFRGKREPCNLLNKDIVVEVQTGGTWKGLKKMWLKGYNVEKSMSLTLNNPVERAGNYTGIVEDKYNPLCIVKLVEFYRRTHLPTNYRGNFSVKERKRWIWYYTIKKVLKKRAG